MSKKKYKLSALVLCAFILFSAVLINGVDIKNLAVLPYHYMFYAIHITGF